MSVWKIGGWFKRKEDSDVVRVNAVSKPLVWNMTTPGAQAQPNPGRKFDNANGIGFTIYPASGGYILEFKTYDIGSDRWNTNLHVVPDGEDFSKAIAETVTLECLRKK